MEIVSEGNLRLVALRASDSESWALMPLALERIARFASEYDSDADSAMLLMHLRASFTHPRGTSQIVLAIDQGQIVGHALLGMEVWYGTPFTTLIQYELDHAIPQTVLRPGLDWMVGWARDNGAKFFQCLARNEAVAKAFERFYGFKRNRILMRKELSTDVAKTVGEA